MSSLSLAASVKTCTVDTGWANRIQSDRFQNPNVMVCPAWNGTDLTGRNVCPDSFYTKNPGCDSAEDRVLVENDQRPKYFNYVTLGAQGVDGHIYGNASAVVDSNSRQKWLNDRYNITGQYGNDFSANLYQSGSCTVGAYERSMAEINQLQRNQVGLQNGYAGYAVLNRSGNRM